MCVGITEELAGIDLGDERLNRRSAKVIEALAANPEASVNGAVSGWGDTQAAYRFFSNDSILPERILEPHRAATVRRIQEHPVVLIVQDTTELDYTDHPTRDALCLDSEHRYGLYQHVELAVTPERLPLGVVAAEAFDRAPESLGTRAERKHAPIEEKESFRWLQGYRRACAIAAECPGTQIVSVADSEADIYDIFLATQEQIGPRAEYVIRTYENRSTPQRNPAVGRRAYHKVRDELERSPVRTTLTIDLGQTPKRQARTARVEVRAMTIPVKPPNDRPHLPAVTHNVILVREVGGPGDGTDIEWLIATTLPIDAIEEILCIIGYYKTRWVVETYFRTLKTGCRIEKIQLETKARLLNCLAMYNIIAWRILHLTHLNRTAPDIPCTAVFEDYEWKPVWRVVTKAALPRVPPKLNEFMKLITHLGGYNNRATETPSGPLPVWVGLRRMLDYSAAWLTFGPEPTKDVCK
jgi:hypothetical protein